MNNKIVCALAFMVGAACGSIATFKFAEKKYKRIADEEIESVKQVFSTRKNSDETEAEDDESEPEQESEDEYKEDRLMHSAIVRGESYLVEDPEMDVPIDRPYIIEPEEFAELDGYDAVMLTLYADGVLENEFGEVIEDIEGLIGKDPIRHFAETYDELVYVRNNKEETDFEVQRDHRRYSEVQGSE